MRERGLRRPTWLGATFWCFLAAFRATLDELHGAYAILPGFHYHEFANQPLSAKWEQGLPHCRQHQPDGVVIVGCWSGWTIRSGRAMASTRAWMRAPRSE